MQTGAIRFVDSKSQQTRRAHRHQNRAALMAMMTSPLACALHGQ
jgi:hypothetical protein